MSQTLDAAGQDLTPAQQQTLLCVHRAAQETATPPTVTDVHHVARERFGRDHYPTLAEHVQALDDAGYLRVRGGQRGDARKKVLRLTDDGQRFLARAYGASVRDRKGRAIDEAPTERKTVRLPPTLAAAVDDYADERGYGGFSDLARAALVEFVGVSE